MSLALEEVLSARQKEDAQNTINSDGRMASGMGAPSYAEYKQAHMSGMVNVDPQQFNMGTPYPVQDRARADYVPYAAQGMQQTYPQQSYANPSYGYTQQYSSQGYAQPYGGQYAQQGYASGAQWQPMPFYTYNAQAESARQAEFENRLMPQNASAAEQEKAEEQVSAQSRPKMKKRLNAKGAVILSLYLAVVAVVITLIGVNAGKINSGKAVVPASNVTITAEQPL